MIEIALWGSLGLLTYTYFGYPAILLLWSRLRPKKVNKGAPGARVSVIVVAYNEEENIGRRIGNLLHLEYPKERVEIIIACDGATDATAEIARSFRRHGVRVIEFARRRGKSSVLNDVVPRATGEIVVFADAAQRFKRDGLTRLLENFADAQVGAVSGELVLLSGRRHAQTGRGSGFYWRYEKFIRRAESRIDSTVGATGAIYAIRRALFSPLPPETFLDDVLIPLNIVRRGYRTVFEPAAIAYDRLVPTARAEWRRKIRTITGTYQLFVRHPWAVLPGGSRLWFQALSHKGLRLLGPACLAVALGSNVTLAWGSPIYGGLLAGQMAFYGAAAFGRLTRDQSRYGAVFNVAYTFCLLNWATLIAFYGALRPGQGRVGTWERTAR